MADSGNQGNQEYSTILGPDASFKGDLTFDKGMRLQGKFDGNITTPGRLHVTKEAKMQANVDVRADIVNGVIKSLVFGVACTMIALFEGYDAPPTAEGVSRATTRTVVSSSLAVLGLDFILTSFMLGM